LGEISECERGTPDRALRRAAGSDARIEEEYFVVLRRRATPQTAPPRKPGDGRGFRLTLSGPGADPAATGAAAARSTSTAATFGNDGVAILVELVGWDGYEFDADDVVAAQAATQQRALLIAVDVGEAGGGARRTTAQHEWTRGAYFGEHGRSA